MNIEHLLHLSSVAKDANAQAVTTMRKTAGRWPMTCISVLRSCHGSHNPNGDTSFDRGGPDARSPARHRNAAGRSEAPTEKSGQSADPNDALVQSDGSASNIDVIFGRSRRFACLVRGRLRAEHPRANCF
jgi:hypothetical protein